MSGAGHGAREAPAGRTAVPGGAFDLTGYLDGERSAVEAALERAVDALTPGLGPSVRAAAEHGVRGGGKRLRPVLCVTAFRAAGGGDPAPAVYDMAAALELIHAYSLMHDDLPCMDDAELRRGRPTTHRVHGVEATTLAGTALIPLAVARAWRGAVDAGCSGDVAREVARTLAGASGAGGMVGGQALDLLGEGAALDTSELDTLHRLKTGALLTAALRMGALAADASPRAREGLERYGRHIGLAFQIADDILDATATARELGKNPSDQALDKSTYVAVHGLDEARRRGRREVDAACRALKEASVASPALEALARYVLDRRR